jgi:general secretion pathway protein L
MARLLGIDIGKTHVRAALLRTGRRQTTVVQLLELDRMGHDSLGATLKELSGALQEHPDAVAVGLDGEKAFIRRMKLPAAANKQLDEVLSFELESQVPVELDELVWDYSVRRRSGDEPVELLVAAARIEEVRQLLDTVTAGLERSPDRVGCGGLPLLNLLRLKKSEPGEVRAVLELGTDSSDVVILEGEVPVFARTVSMGVQGLPDTAELLVARLRQTLSSHGAVEPTSVLLAGTGVEAPGITEYLSHHLGLPCERLSGLGLLGVSAEVEPTLGRWAKALGLALGLGWRPADLDLRRGPFASQRGLGFLKQKAPVLGAVGAVLLGSYVFFAWAQLSALGTEQEVLGRELAKTTKALLGKEVTDSAAAEALLDEKLKQSEPDPMPHVDAFDVMIELSRAVPPQMKHDVEELDIARQKVRINALVGTTTEAEEIVTALRKVRCFKDVKTTKVTQEVNGSRQKYQMEFGLECPEDAKATKKAEEPKPAKKEETP